MKRTRTKNEHHCYNLADCKGLLEQMGFTFDERASFENDEYASAISEQKVGVRRSGIVSLNKQTGHLACTDNTK